MRVTDGMQGEHGVGLVKRDYLPHELGETTVDAMRQVRAGRSPTHTCAKLTVFADQKGV